MHTNLKIQIGKLNVILKKLSIKEKLEMPEIKIQEFEIKKKIEHLNKLTKKNLP